MFNPTTILDSERILNGLGSFYLGLDSDTQETLKQYWTAMYTGVEGLIFELFQAELTSYLDYTPGYLEHAYQALNLSLYQTYPTAVDVDTNVETSYMDVPTGLSGAPETVVSSGSSYIYRVTAITDFGETTLSVPLVVMSGGSDLSVNNNTIEWTSISGATHYNVYGRSLGETQNLLGSPTTNSYTDSGDSGIIRALPTENTAIKTFRYGLGTEKAFMSIPTLSGYNTNQTLLEQIHFEIEDLHKIKLLKPIHRTIYTVEQGVVGEEFIINNVRNRALTLKKDTRYIFDIDTIDSFHLTSDSVDLVTPAATGFIEYTPTVTGIIYYTDPSLGSVAISVVDDIDNVIFCDDAREPYNTGEEFLALAGYSLLPSLLSIYFPGFGITTPEDIVLNNQYEPYIDGYATGVLTYSEKRRAYAVHLKNWAYAYSNKLRSAPTMPNLEQSLALVHGLPFTYESGIISTITNTGGYNYVTVPLADGTDRVYEITENLLLSVVEGDSVAKFDILCSGITAIDYITDETTVSGFLTKYGNVKEYDVGTDHINNHAIKPKFIERLDFSVRTMNVTGEN